MKVRCWLPALLVLVAGCSWARSSASEYASYRKTRVEPSLDARMAAAHDYLLAYPDGAYADEVRRRYARNEPLYFESRRRTEQGLEAYLKSLPQGPHAAEVRSLLAVIAERRGKPDQLSAAASETEAKLAQAAQSREHARDELTFWVDSLTDKDAYAAPMAEGPADLVVAFSLSLPAPVCHAEPPELRVCSKQLSLPFAIPGAPEMLQRELAFSVTLVQDARGRPTRARIEGAELFSRLDETRSLTAVAPDDSAARGAAIGSAVDQIAAAFEGRISADPACQQQPTPPEVLRLACSGMRVTAIAGGEAGAPDAIEFEPASDAPPPAP